MRRWCALVLVAAVLIAVVGCSSDAKTDAPTVVSASEPSSNQQLVKVFKVVQPIPKGLSGLEAIQAGYVTSAALAAEFRPVNAIDDINVIRDLVAADDLAPGQVLIDGMFAEPPP